MTVGSYILGQVDNQYFNEWYKWYNKQWKKYPGAETYTGNKMPYRRTTKKRSRRSSKRAKVATGGGRSRMFDLVGGSRVKTAVSFVGLGTDNPEWVGTSLKTWALDAISKGTGLNQRERDICNLRGIKIFGHIRNVETTPLTVHMAILYPKFDTTPLSVDFNVDFFRDLGPVRGINFDTANNYIVQNRPINPDRFVILKHRRFNLISDTQATPQINEQSGKNYRNFKFYIKVRKQLRFRASENNPTNGRLFFAVWATPMGWDGGKGTPDPSKPQAAQIMFEHSRWFKDSDAK